MEITFSIIGSAGRNDDIMSKSHFEAMCKVASGLLQVFAECNYNITHLVSGGAAFADHVAVTLFLRKLVPNLRLYVPVEFSNGSFKSGRFSNDSYTTEKDYGSTLNYYHHQFKTKCFIHSLSEIQSAIHRGAEIHVCKGGFYGRNAMVAKSDFLLACTYGDKEVLKEGGSADTLRRYLDRINKEKLFDKSFHYCLTDGKIYNGAKPPLKKNNGVDFKNLIGKAINKLKDNPPKFIINSKSF